MSEILQEIRCKCGKLLGKALGKAVVEIKCPRCREMTRKELAVSEGK